MVQGQHVRLMCWVQLAPLLQQLWMVEVQE
jgi:hypothetical protein